ncbi:MAG: tetratricopeptide repeat protein, partial [bacterium]|nr:tetratricopeptide repeat protein [bacterium]
VSLSLALNYAVGGLEVESYHAFNLLIHLLSGLLVAGIVRRTLLRCLTTTNAEHTAAWLAGIISVIWTVHPLQTDSVTYVIQRTELMAGCCYLLALYGAIRGWSSTRPRRWFMASVVACGLGMCSKEMVVSAPLLVWLYDRTFVSGTFGAALRRHARLYVGLALTWVVLGAILLSAPRSATVGFGLGVSAVEYLCTQAGVIVRYLRLSFWPNPLVVSYDWALATSPSDWLAPGLLVVGLLAGTAWSLLRRSWWGVVGAWFFMILAPTSSFVPIVTERAAERRMYLPLIAVTVVTVVLVWQAGRRLLAHLAASTAGSRILGAALALVVIAALVLGTHRRNEDYRSALAIWTDTVQKRPRNDVAHSKLGNALYALGRVEEAVHHYRTAVLLQDDRIESHYNLANGLVELEELDEAFEHYEHALRLRPDYAEAHNNYGRALALQGRYEEAARHLDKALQAKPGYAEAHINMANLLRMQGRLEAALTHCREALRADPADPNARMMLADTLLDAGDLTQAVVEYREVLRTAPDNASAHCNLGIALAMLNQPRQAVAELRRALELDPNHHGARQVLARVLTDETERDAP